MNHSAELVPALFNPFDGAGDVVALVQAPPHVFDLVEVL